MNTHFSIEKSDLDIGFMPLTDCAPVVIAKEMGFFERWGLNNKAIHTFGAGEKVSSDFAKSRVVEVQAVY